MAATGGQRSGSLRAEIKGCVREPFAIEQDEDRATVTSRVTGNFRGGPVDLRYSFVLETDKIASLEIGL
ncbi:hypothetical protein [Bosea sp. 685]|uniref:hypothetical protein n=1 Tax=Bosea sp. 685 TaxID=3080057 RepID=UPI0028937EFA|nr:hypothetical protein [Bosea sp. 685]WNJ88527.1 hypothetical protein RMR04_19170 [Bosea sp. 685]